jgi:transcription antitermination factor NusG
MHQWKDREKTVELPVFPGYLFIRLAASIESRLAVVRTEGTVCILGQGERIEPVPDEEIGKLQLLLESSARCLAHPLVREGAWVRVRRGPLKNLEGLLVRFKNQTRLVLSITLLSQSVSTEVDSSNVEFVRSAATQRRIG